MVLINSMEDAVGWFTRKKTGPVRYGTGNDGWQSSQEPASTPTLVDVYGAEPAVRTVVDFIARNIASLPFKAYHKQTDGDRIEVTTGSLARLIARPSTQPGQTRFTFFNALILDGLLYDRFMCFVVRSDDGLALRRIAPRNFSLTTNGNDEVTGVTVTVNGHSEELALPNAAVVLSTGYASQGVAAPITRTLADLLAEAREMADYRRSIAKYGGRFDRYVFRPAGCPWENQEAYDDFVQGLRNYKRGGGMEGQMPALADGMEIRSVPDGFKPVDVADLDARDRIAITVCNAYHISPENLGLRDGTKSSVEAHKDELWNIELMPYIAAFEQALNNVLPAICGHPDQYVEANIDAKLRGTLETQYQALSTATGRPFMTANEARRLMNRPAVPEGDQLITPLNVTIGGQPSPQDGGVTQAAQEGTTA